MLNFRPLKSLCLHTCQRLHVKRAIKPPRMICGMTSRCPYRWAWLEWQVTLHLFSCRKSFIHTIQRIQQEDNENLKERKSEFPPELDSEQTRTSACGSKPPKRWLTRRQPIRGKKSHHLPSPGSISAMNEGNRLSSLQQSLKPLTPWDDFSMPTRGCVAFLTRRQERKEWHTRADLACVRLYCSLRL